jgi:ABC-type amino acid transport substrate-binding protein
MPPRQLLASTVTAAVVAVLDAIAPASDLPQIRSRGVLRAIVAADEGRETFDPAGGKQPGFERELLETFVRLQGLRLEAVTARAYSDRIPMLLAGQGDLIVAIFDTPERRQQVAFTAEVMPTYNVAVTLAPRAPIRTIEELRQAKVGVVRGTATAEDAAELGPASLRRYEASEPMLAALRAGEVTALVLPVSELALAMKKVPNLQAGVPIGESGSVAWAVRKEDEALRAALDQHLANVRRSASWNLLLVKYFGERAPLVLGRRR